MWQRQCTAISFESRTTRGVVVAAAAAAASNQTQIRKNGRKKHKCSRVVDGHCLGIEGSHIIAFAQSSTSPFNTYSSVVAGMWCGLAARCGGDAVIIA